MTSNGRRSQEQPLLKQNGNDDGAAGKVQNYRTTTRPETDGSRRRPARSDEETPTQQIIGIGNDSEGEDDDSEDEEQETYIGREFSWRTYFLQDISHNRFLEMQLMVLTFGTGILDAFTYAKARNP